MKRYRKIDPRIWKDEKFTPLPARDKLIVFYCITAQSNRIGLFSFSPGQGSEDLKLSIKTFGEGFGKVCEKFKFSFDKLNRVLYIPTWWKYNHPENPNVLKACMYDLHDLPRTPLVELFSINKQYLSETFHQTFEEGLAFYRQTFHQTFGETGAGAGAGTGTGIILSEPELSDSDPPIPVEIDSDIKLMLSRCPKLSLLSNGVCKEFWDGIIASVETYKLGAEWLNKELIGLNGWMVSKNKGAATVQGAQRRVGFWIRRALDRIEESR